MKEPDEYCVFILRNEDGSLTGKQYGILPVRLELYTATVSAKYKESLLEFIDSIDGCVPSEYEYWMWWSLERRKRQKEINKNK